MAIAKRVGVIGAGQMGNGIAHVCALAGLPVMLLDVKPAALEKALATIGQQHGPPGQPQGGSRPRTEEAALARITTGTDYAGVRRLRPRDRGGDREGGGQASDLQALRRI